MKLEYMNIAIKEAEKAFKKDEVPVGAVIVYNDKIIAKAHNTRQKTHKVINHAEILAILKAERKLKDWRMNNCELYVTLKPCNMCESIIKEARISKVYYILDKFSNKKDYNKTKFVRTNVCFGHFENYNKILSEFFENKRKN